MKKHISYLAVLLLAAANLVAQTSNVLDPQALPATAREQWQMNGRAGQGTAGLRRQAIQQKLRMRSIWLAAKPFAVLTGGWNSLGPLPLPSDASGTGIQDYGWVSGRATAVAIDPNDPRGNTVFVGGAYGGVWKSTNAGDLSPNPASVIWTPLTDDQLTLAIGAIAVQPQVASPDPNKSVVLAGTGETNSSVDSYYGLGILCSIDGGVNWTLIAQDATGTHSFAGLGFSQITFSTTNPRLVVAAAASASQGIVEGLETPTGADRGLYYSTDAGATWNAASIADSGLTVTGASVTSAVFNAAAGKFYAAVRYHGFYVSTNGANWTRLATQPVSGLASGNCPAQAQQPSSCAMYRGVISVVPGRTGPSGLGEMYAWYVDGNDSDQGIWSSSNAGVSWAQVNDSGITNCGDFFGGCGTAQGNYNLTLTAIPNGSATDLYAGATNLYKCTIYPGSSPCNGTGTNTFVNLTHVYGCSDIAKVHPNQHAMDFLLSNGAALMFFANDGGIYRALDGFTGLTTGTCGLFNQFDNLNATLGPITQFVSIAQSTTDQISCGGGTQGNGAPATSFLQSGGQWANVNAGDIGFPTINPTDDNEWFLSLPPDAISGVNVFRCSNGINCHTQDFQNDPIVSSASVGGDASPFYLPFVLDPANPSTMLLGTCRVWRGSTSGGSFSPLSPNFEVGGNGTCSGTETNMVRALVAGGPRDNSGNSQVIYAATNGEGPSVPATQAGGRIWITTNAAGGPNTWLDRTGSINPQGFPVSNVVMDPADPSGHTAYAAIMGFHAAHVWKTISAGLSWLDFSGAICPMLQRIRL
jgi:large repetitive protein